MCVNYFAPRSSGPPNERFKPRPVDMRPIALAERHRREMGRRLPTGVTRPCDSAERRAAGAVAPGIHFLFSRGPYSRQPRQGSPESPTGSNQTVSGSDSDFQRALGRSPPSLLLAGSSISFSQVLSIVGSAMFGSVDANPFTLVGYREIRDLHDSMHVVKTRIGIRQPATQGSAEPLHGFRRGTNPVLTTHNGMVKWRSGMRVRHSPTFPTMGLLDQAPQAFLEEFVERDRQVPNTLPSGVENCICDGRRRPGDSDFANSARAQRRMFVRYTGVNDVDVRNIHIDRNMILGQRWIHDSPPAFIEEGFFS